MCTRACLFAGCIKVLLLLQQGLFAERLIDITSLDTCDVWAANLASRYAAPPQTNIPLASFNLAMLLAGRSISCLEGGKEDKWTFAMQMVSEEKTVMTACIDAICFDSVSFLEEYVTGEGPFEIQLAPSLFFDTKFIRYKIFGELSFRSKVSLQIKNIARKRLQANDGSWEDCLVVAKDSNIEHPKLEWNQRVYKNDDRTPGMLNQCTGWYDSAHPCASKAETWATSFMKAFKDDHSRLQDDTYNFDDSNGGWMRIIRTSVQDPSPWWIWFEFLGNTGPHEANPRSRLLDAVMQWVLRSHIPWCSHDFKLHLQSQDGKTCNFLHIASNSGETGISGATYNGHFWTKLGSS